MSKTQAVSLCRIAGGFLAIALSYYFFSPRMSQSPRAVMFLNGCACIAFGLAMLIWARQRWAVITLLVVFVTTVYGGDVYEVIAGNRHWFRLVPIPVVALLYALDSTRRQDAG